MCFKSNILAQFFDKDFLVAKSSFSSYNIMVAYSKKDKKVVKSLTKNCAKILLFFTLFLTNSRGQEITVPAENALGSKIVATVTNAPKGTILWSTHGLEVESSNNNLFIWGKAGTYQINCIIVPLKRITIGDQTFDIIDGEIKRLDKSFKITGSVPDPPNPEPDDIPFETF
jgi:hypothetical protein